MFTQREKRNGKRGFQSSRPAATREARRGSMIGSFRSRWTDGEEKAVNGSQGIYFYFISSDGKVMLQMDTRAVPGLDSASASIRLGYFDIGANHSKRRTAESNLPTVWHNFHLPAARALSCAISFCVLFTFKAMKLRNLKKSTRQ